MGQVRKNTFTQAIKPQLQDNVLPNIEIRPDIHQHWFDALGEFAGMMRLQRDMKRVVHFDKEEGYINGSGELVVVAGVNNETLEMAFPVGTWEWKKESTV